MNPVLWEYLARQEMEQRLRRAELRRRHGFTVERPRRSRRPVYRPALLRRFAWGRR